MAEFRIEHLGPEDEKRWDELALRTCAAPFLRPGWTQAWAQAFAGASDMQAATVRRGGDLVGVLPLVRRGGALLGAANAETPGVGAVLADTAAADALAQGLFRGCARRVDLTFLPDGDPLTAALRRAEQERERTLLWHSMRSQPFVDTRGMAAEYEERRLSTRRRRDLRRQERRLATLGDVELEIRNGDRDLEALVDEGFRMEADGWKGRAGTAVLVRPATREFYVAMARWAAEVGILRLAFLRVSGTPVAFSFALEQNGVHYGLKLVYDESFANLGPGLLLMHRLIRRAFDEPALTRFELLGEADSYKMEFADGATEQLRVRIFGEGLWGALGRAIADTQHSARQAARERLPEPTRARLTAAVARLSR
jgi:CelD/BcsL family acetyltransferase involved in cellulose biosynthesis